MSDDAVGSLVTATALRSDLPVLRRAIAAILEGRDVLHATTATYITIADRYETTNPYRCALARARAQALQSAVQEIDDSLITAFDLWSAFEPPHNRHPQR